MVGIPNRLPKYINVCFKEFDGAEFCDGIVLDAFDSEVPENVRQDYISKYQEIADKGSQKELSAVIKTNKGEYVLIPVKNLTTMTQSASPSEAKNVDIEEELQKIYANMDPTTTTLDGESVSEQLRKLLYTISLKNKA